MKKLHFGRHEEDPMIGVPWSKEIFVNNNKYFSAG